jgi:glycosyltransferase involved in cell wall biosynthesis
MNILHTVAGLWEGTGGPVSSITSLCSGLAEAGHAVTLLTGAGPIHPAVRALSPRVRVRIEPLGSYRAAHWSRPFRTACLEEARAADIVHDHGVWLFTNWSSVQMAGRAGRPVVRSPRGMLSPWALGRSPRLKRLAWIAIEKRLFDRAALVHATSELERSELEALHVGAPTVVIPNGVDLEGELSRQHVADARVAGLADADGRRNVVFLSRIHPKKGLDLLCAAWSQIPSATPATLLIGGPGEGRTLAEMERWIQTQPGPPARYLGPITREQRLPLLSSAWLMALPSHSENYGMVVAEALACGTPVLVSTEMPWAEVEAAGCGWIAKPHVDSIASILRRALSLSPGRHGDMRVAARSLVERSHSLTDAVSRMSSAYERAIADGSPTKGASS